ncbi:MAG TPA: S24 family peptidase [Chitinophagaceae bacterium]|nr:S24 family peptidase [Chitinophagaceae bacterium]
MFRHSQIIKVKKQRIKNPVTDPDFGKSSFSIPVNQKLIKKGKSYFWLPTVGDSMTDNTGKSIPAGSLVLVSEINIENFRFTNVPMHKALIITGYERTGKMYNILKTIRFIDMYDNRFLLRSYNHTFHDFYIPITSVKRIFEVELVRLPSGTEFIPTVWRESITF